MGSQLNVEVSQQELVYRSKYYHDIRAVRQRELSCASCGNVVSHECGRVFSHPILGILQCRKCKDQFNDTPLNIDDCVNSCSLCGIPRRLLYKCSRKNCPHQFCESCIKRNAPLSLVDARTERWKCFACNTQPLWKLRGACAAVMSTIPKRTKTKKVSRNSSSDREDAKSVLKNISSVRRNREVDARKLIKRLRLLCDNDSPYEPVQRRLYKVTPSQHIPPVTTSDDSDTTIIPLWKKKKLKKKSQRDASPESRMKRLASMKKGSRGEINVGSTSSKDKKKASGRAGPMSSKVVFASNSEISSQDSDSDIFTASITSKFDKQKINDENINAERKQRVQADSCDEGSVDTQMCLNTRSKKSSTMSTVSFSKTKSARTTRNNDESSKHSRIVGSNERESVAGPTSSKDRESARSTRSKKRHVNPREKSSDDTVDSDCSSTIDTMNHHTRDSKEDHETRDSRKSQKNDNTDSNTRKSYINTKNRKETSDESSGKDFKKLKVIRQSYVALKRLCDIEKDRTKSPENSPELSKDLMSKDQTFALKNTVNNFFAAMKTATTRLLNDIERAQTTYSMKDSMHPMEVDRMILDVKNVVGNFKQHVEIGENKMVDRYDKWCKKTRIKNVLKKRGLNVDDEKSPLTKTNTRESRSNTAASGNESSTSVRIASPPRNNETLKNSQSLTTEKGEQSAAVSDCNSEDIFTDDEMRISNKKSRPISPDQKSTEESPNVKSTGEKRTERKESICLGDDSDKIDHLDDERMSSTEAAVEDDNENIVENAGPKSPAVSDFGKQLSLDASVIDNEDNNSENCDSLSLSFVVSDNENNVEISGAKSPAVKDSQKQLSLDTPVVENNEENRNEVLDSTSQAVIDNDNDTISNTARSKSPAVVDDGNEQIFDETSSKSTMVENRERESSLEPIVDGDVEKKQSNSGSKSSSIQDSDNEANDEDLRSPPIDRDAKRHSSLETLLNDDDENAGKMSTSDFTLALSGDNNDETENLRLTSPVVQECEDGLSSNTNKDTIDEKESEKSVSQSLVAEDSLKQSSLDTILDEDNEKKKKSDSKSSLHKNATRRSSLSDDRENLVTNLNSKSSTDNDSRPISNSSEISDSEEARMREALLASSNSDDSSGEGLFSSHKSNRREVEESLPTPPESDSNSKSVKKTRSRRRKFCIDDNRHVKADAKLKLSCEVRVARMEKKVLRRYAGALNKSRDFVESRMLKRLVKLDNLDKDTNVASNSSGESENAPVSSKDVKNKKRTQGTKEREETLMDHLERIANGENIELGNESDGETSIASEDRKIKSEDQNDDSLFDEANRMAKKRLLESSDSAEEESATIEPEDGQKTKEKTKETTKDVKKRKAAKSSEDDDKKEEKADASRWRKNKLLTLTISDSDSEAEKEKFELRQEKLAQKNKDQGSRSNSEEEQTPTKKRVRRRVLHSDSDVKLSDLSNNESSDDSIRKKKKNGSDSGSDKKKKEGKKKTRKRSRRGERRSSDSSDSMEEKRPKVRRKRIKTAGSDSDSENDLDTSQGTPGKSGRKNIRKVIRDKQVAADTKQAARDEEERLKRIAERQKLYNEMYEVRLAGEQKVEKLVLDFDDETKEPLVSVNEALVKRLKPHQAQGIKFMWDACFESLDRTKTTPGSGCILAHCMGLGKSFQIVSLSHTLLQHPETGIKTIMVVCPLSTVLNWVNEFKIWLENLDDGDDIEVYELTKMKKNFERKYQLQRWQETGGVMIIGYEMFRNLSSTTGKKVRKNIQATFLKCLVDPGPDLIVCDEGHLLKNEDTALSKAMRRVKTLRRIVLTGTPLQNNLIEYHCMVQFVKPNLLGTKKEFMNRFENPITNGQFDDSTEYDVKLMKKRAHVLHKMLEGSVQRLDYSVLTPFLPPKQEYVMFLKLTEIQMKMYQHYLEYYARRHRGVGGSLFADFQALQRIWTHPMVMQMNAEKVVLANEKKRLEATDSEGSLKDFIDDDSNSDSSSKSSDIRSINGTDDDSSKKPKRGTRANPVIDDPLPAIVEKSEETNDEIEWWTQFVKEDDYDDMRISSKLLILFSILKESEHIGDKVLVFSQSLYSLSLIEKYLSMIDDETQNGNSPETLGNHSGSWSLGLDYFRLDGQTSPDNRRRWCEIFNRPSNTRARLFLISTRAGGLGINLTAANRVIIFDASWNPSHDVQSIFRIYRFGQKKPCYVYRLLAAGTMEEKIYNRQVTKLSLSCRVVDEQQIERHYSNNALAELYKLDISEEETTLNLPKDRVLAEIFLKHKTCVRNYHEHDSLLENQAGEELDEEERQQAWIEYEEEKKGKRIMPQIPMNTYQNEILMQQMNMINLQQQHNLNNPSIMADIENFQRLMAKDYPGVTEAQHKMMASRAVYEMYNYVERQALSNQNVLPMLNMGMSQLGYDNRIAQVAPTSSHPTPEMLRLYQQSLSQRQQPNGQPQMNYAMNTGIMGDKMIHSRNNPINQISQLPAQPSVSTVRDEDVVEIPSSPEKNSVPPSPAPGGSRKSQEE